jgi:hypothetical protein
MLHGQCEIQCASPQVLEGEICEYGEIGKSAFSSVENGVTLRSACIEYRKAMGVSKISCRPLYLRSFHAENIFLDHTRVGAVHATALGPKLRYDGRAPYSLGPEKTFLQTVAAEWAEQLKDVRAEADAFLRHAGQPCPEPQPLGPFLRAVPAARVLEFLSATSLLRRLRDVRQA